MSGAVSNLKRHPARPVESAVKARIRNSWLIQVIRPVRKFVVDSREFVLDSFSFLARGLPSRVLVTAMPKSGTHLILEAIGNLDEIGREPLLLDYRHSIRTYEQALQKLAPNRYAYGHIGANAETIRAAAGYSVIVMLRDPRDIIISHIDHAYRLKPSVLREYYASLADDKERIKAAIRGVPRDGYAWDPELAQSGAYEALTGHSDIATVCRSYLAWQNAPGVRSLVVHYGELIGEKGGGTRERQYQTVRNIVEFLGLDYDEDGVRRLCAKIYNPGSPTFNHGGQGRWREIFDDEIKDLFKATAGRELIEMGYEKDDRW